MSETDWTLEEQGLIEASRAYFLAIAVCADAGGRVQPAIIAAMPDEIKAAGGEMAAALGGIG